MAILLEGQKYAPIPIAGFIQQLANNGLVTISGQYDPIFALLEHYFPQGIEVNYTNNQINADPASVALFQQVLCPLLAKSQQEQEIFLRVSKIFFDEKLFELYLYPENKKKEDDNNTVEKRNLKIPIWLKIPSFIVIFAFLCYIYYQLNPSPDPYGRTTEIAVPPTPAPQNKYIPQPEPLITANDRPVITINYPLAVFLSLGSGVLAILMIWAAKTKPTVIKKNKKPPYFFFIPEKDHLIRNFGTMYLWTKNLLQRKESLQNRLDIKRSIQVSIKNGGYSTVVLKPILQRPKYLFFIDFDFYDQQVYVFRFLTNFLFGEGVDLELFYFRLDPRKCWNTSHPLGITLADLKISYPAHKLVLFTEGSNLVDLQKGSLHSWVREGFSSWEQKVILTPKARDRWGIIENIMSETFTLLPADINGFTAMSEYLNFPEKDVLTPALQHLQKNPEHTKNTAITSMTAETVTLVDIRAFFSGAKAEPDIEQLLLQWAYATALYAAPSWDITLLIGNTIQQRAGSTKLVNLPNLLLITALPWLKINHIPVSLRKSLLENLDPVYQTEVIGAIIESLAQKDHTTAEDSVAALEKKVKILELTALLPNRKNASTGKKELLAYHRGGMVKDPLVKALLIKNLRNRRYQHFFLVAGIIFLAFFVFSRLLTKTVPDQAVYHNNLAAGIANEKNTPLDSNRYNRILSELQQSLAIRELFEAFYNLKSLKYNFAIKYYNPDSANRFNTAYFKGESTLAINSILSPLRLFYGKDYVPDEAVMTDFLMQLGENSADRAYTNLQVNGQLGNIYVKEKFNREMFEAAFNTARLIYNPMKTILPFSDKSIFAKNAITDQTQLDSLIRLDALYIILYKGGPRNPPIESKPKKTTTEGSTRGTDASGPEKSRSNIRDTADEILQPDQFLSAQEQTQTNPTEETQNIDTPKANTLKLPVTPLGVRSYRREIPGRPKNKSKNSRVVTTATPNNDFSKAAALYQTDTLKLLYQPLINLLAQSKDYYDRYTENDYTYQYAKQINLIDRQILALLENNSNLFSDKMKPAAKILITHLTAWTDAFSEMSGGKRILDAANFRVIYTGPTFKDVPSNDLQKEYTRLQKSQ